MRPQSKRLLLRVKRRLAAGARDERGAVAVIFAVSLLVLAPLMLGLFDVYLVQNQQAQLQDALDTATLYAARSTATTDTAIDSLGDAALKANINLPDGVSLVTSTFKIDGDKVVSTATITSPALTAGLIQSGNVVASSEVVRGMDRLEIALVLDNTGSMQGTKLTTLKSAGKDLVDKLAAAAARSTDPTPIRISLVPFSNTVRALNTQSLTSYNATTHTGANIPAWVDPQGRAHWPTQASANNDIFDTWGDTDRLAHMKDIGASWNGCVEARRQPYDIQETAPIAGTPASYYIPYFWPDEADFTNSQKPYNNYLVDGSSSTDGKVRMRRSAKYTGTPSTGTFALDSSAYGGPYYKGPNGGCELQPLIPLTTDMARVKTAINAMTAVGETNIPLGLAWGWNTLSPVNTYWTTAEKGSAYGTKKLRKIIILMTDGENTLNDPSYSAFDSFYGGLGYFWQGLLGITSGTSATRTTAINNRLSALCTNIKAKDITVYTVRVEVSSGTSTLLKNCASTPDKFYDVQDVADLNDAFTSIAASIDNLRISK